MLVWGGEKKKETKDLRINSHRNEISPQVLRNISLLRVPSVQLRRLMAREVLDTVCVLNLEPSRSSDSLNVLGHIISTSYFILTPPSIAVFVGSKFVRHVDRTRETVTKLIPHAFSRHCRTRHAVGHPSKRLHYNCFSVVLGCVCGRRQAGNVMSGSRLLCE